VTFFQYVGIAFRYFPVAIGAVKAARNNPDIMALIDAIPSIVRDFGGPPDSSTSLHETLKKAGIDTKQLAEAIHPPGPSSSGNPDAFNAGSNNVS
jgi:hypothetical protein